MIWFKKYSLEELDVYAKLPGLTPLLDITICEVGDDYLKARMPVNERVHQVFGIMHGGASCTLVETAGSFASRMVVDPEQQYSVGSVIHVNHLRPIKGGVLIATCKPVHLGRQKHVWDIPVYEESSGKLIAKGELTCAVINGKIL